VRRLLLGLVAVVSLAFAPNAAHLFAQGQSAEKAGHFDRAYVLYSEAAALEPNNTTYWLRSQAVRARAELQVKQAPTQSALLPQDQNPPPPEVTARDLADTRTPNSPLELMADPTPRDFDLQGNSRTLFEKVAQAFQLQCVFDNDFDAARTFRFEVQAMDYHEAIHALESATGSFTVSLSSRQFLVVKDTPQKRTEFEPFVTVTVAIPQATTPQELTELMRGVQQTIGLEKVALDSQNNMVILRGPISKVVPARMLFEGLMRYRSEVLVELEFVEVNRHDMLSYGLTLPNSFPLVNLRDAVQLSKLASGSVTGMFGLAVASAQMLAQMSNSIGHSLMKVQLRSAEGQPATLHVGDRYPVMTTSYVGSTTSTSTSSSTPSPATANGTGTATNGTATNTPATTAPTTFGDVQTPSAMATADFNGDGFADLAVAAAGASAAAILLGKGDGTFQDAVTYPTGSNPSAIVAADLNHDGILDLVTADAGSNTISILLGKGDGTFAAATQVAVGSAPVALAVADFNSDGIPDIAVANSGSNNISILPGRGDGTFQTALTQAAGTSPHSLVAADLNGDGLMDLAVANFGSNDLWILFGNGNGTFSRDATYATGGSPRAVVADNLTTTGAIDLVVANSASNTVSVFLGQGAGRFADGVEFPTGVGPVSMATGDFNSDGLQDIAVANATDGTISLLLGLGTGAFQTAISFPAGSGPSSVLAGDFNRDGLRDLVAANSVSNNFSMLLGAGTGTFHDPGGTYFPPGGGQTYTPPPAFTFEDLGPPQGFLGR
jgi:hypothetical protein